MPDHAAHAGYQAERLSIDLLYLRVEVGQQQPGQLKAALIHHEPAHRRRRVRAGIVSMAVLRAHLPPRHRIGKVGQLQLVQREFLR